MYPPHTQMLAGSKVPSPAEQTTAQHMLQSDGYRAGYQELQMLAAQPERTATAKTAKSSAGSARPPTSSAVGPAAMQVVGKGNFDDMMLTWVPAGPRPASYWQNCHAAI